MRMRFGDRIYGGQVFLYASKDSSRSSRKIEGYEGSVNFPDPSIVSDFGDPQIIASFVSNGHSQGDVNFRELGANEKPKGRTIFSGTTKAFINYFNRFLRTHYRLKQLGEAMGNVMHDYRKRTGKRLNVRRR